MLIVEDEPLIALDIAEEVSAHGAHACITSTVDEALSAISRITFNVAVVDHRLRGEDATEVIRRLETLQIPYVIHSGYEDVEAWTGVPVVRKPAIRRHLVQTISDLL